MNIKRTPDECFRDLPGYDFQPHYIDIPDPRFNKLRMHYLDEGNPAGKIILLLHGQGCWSYIFRNMIPELVTAGYRVIVPDYIGFGRSDKLPNTDDYSFQNHIDWLVAFLTGMKINDVIAYMFDWGGYFGLRIAAEHPDFFSRIVLTNTHLPKGDSVGESAKWFITWREKQLALPRFPQGEMVNEGVVNKLTPDIIAAFDAPYPDESFKAAPRRFPMILPFGPDSAAGPANQAAWEKLASWKKPVLTLFSKSFAGSAMGPELLLSHLPGAQNQPHCLLENASFYVVEDQPVEIARHIVRFADNSED